MSLNRGDKTLTGDDTFEVDEINIVGQGIGINNNFGSSGQLLKKNPIDNSIEWSSGLNATLTIQGSGANPNPTTFDGSGDKVVNISSNTVAAPITLNGGEIGFDATNTDINITTTGGIQANNIVATGDLVVNSNCNLNGNITTIGNSNTDTLLTKGIILFFDGNTARGTFVPSTGTLTIPNMYAPDSLFVGDGGQLIVSTAANSATFGANTIFGGNVVMSENGAETFDFNGHRIVDVGGISLTNTGGSGHDATGNITGVQNISAQTLTLSSSLNMNNIDLDLGSGDFECHNIVCHNILGDNFAITNGSIFLQLSGVATITMNHTNGIISCRGLGTAGGNLGTAGGDINTTNGNIELGSGGINTTGSIGCGPIVSGALIAQNITTTGNIIGAHITASTGNITSNTGAFIATYPGSNSILNQITINPSSMLSADYSTIKNLNIQQLLFQELTANYTPIIDWATVSTTGTTRINLQGGSIVSGEDATFNRIKTSSSLLTICDFKTNTVKFRNRNIELSDVLDDLNYINKYSDSFVINTEDIAAGSGGYEYYFNSPSWFIADWNEMGTGPFEPLPSVGAGPGVQQSGTGTGSSGGFPTYPHIIMKGNTAAGVRKVFSKRFPKYGLSDIERIIFRVIEGSGTNGGEAPGTGDNLYLVWSDANGAFPVFPTETSVDNTYYKRMIDGGAYPIYGSWSFITYTLTTDFTAAQKTAFQSARRICFLSTHTNYKPHDHYGITNISFQTQNEQVAETECVKMTAGPAMMGKASNQNYVKANNTSLGSLSGGLAYLGINYSNGWYYQQLDLGRFITDDDVNTPSSLTIVEPTVSVSSYPTNGSIDNTAGLICNGGPHTQLFYPISIPPGYAIVAYYITLNDANGARINPDTHNSGFYNTLIMCHSGSSNSQGLNYSRVISQPTNSNGTPDNTASTSFLGFNREHTIGHNIYGGTYPVFGNTFQGFYGTEQFGSYSDLSNWKQYYIHMFRTGGWSSAFKIKGGYIKLRRLDPGEV